jgi:regulator of protease activity HflC (stomatin/prohibitin superfamily)
MIKTVLFIVIASMLGGCFSIVRPGEVGVKRRLGKLKETIRPQGLYVINPITTRMLKVPIRTLNLQIQLEALPSKEGLTIQAEFAVLYHAQPESALKVIETIGLKNAQGVLTSVARSAAANVTARYFAKDMHTVQRAAIEKEIAQDMTKILGDRGLVVEHVLLKSIRLPDELRKAIESKLSAEQEAQRMEFVIKQEKLEAERKKIEAEGIRNAQKIIAEGLSDLVIRYQAIEAFRELSKSNNAKVIITNGTNPLLIDNK